MFSACLRTFLRLMIYLYYTSIQMKKQGGTCLFSKRSPNALPVTGCVFPLHSGNRCCLSNSGQGRSSAKRKPENIVNTTFSGWSMVEHTGFEPVTPTLPVWCAPSCANAPELAEMVGFEPTERFTAQTISSRSRYDHFDTSPQVRRIHLRCPT